MKAFLILILIISASVVIWQRYRSESPLISEQTNGANSFHPTDIPKNDYIEIKDKKGRPLICKITAKKASFVEIEREADRQRFVISLSSVDAPSRRMLASSKDFNAADLDPEIYKLAKANLKAELLIAPELNYFRCPKSGQMMKSSKGLEVDSYKDDLKNMGLAYQERPFQLKKVADGGVFYPDGIRDLPCLRIGNTIVYGRNPAEIRNVVIDEYIRLVALTEM